MFKSGNRLGDIIGACDAVVVNRTGQTCVYGDVVQFDLLGSDGDVNTLPAHLALAAPSSDNHPLGNVILPTTQAITQSGLWAVVQDTSVADNAKMKVRIQGLTKINCAGSSAVVAGDSMVAQNGSDTATVGADASCNIAKALEAGPTGSAAPIWSLFDGCQFNPAGAAGS